MILECPACHARFSLADSLMPPAGRTVRCGKCSHQWHATASAPAAAVAVPTPVANSGAQAPVTDDFLNHLEAAMSAPETVVTRLRTGPAAPAKLRTPINPKPFKIAVPILAAVWLVAAFITYFPRWQQAPVLSGIYAAFGVKPLDGLVFADVNMERAQEGSKTKSILTGSISNHSSAVQAVPTVRVLLKDKNHKTIWGRDYPVNAELKAGDVYPFRITNVETSFAGSVSSIVVDMGNSLQLLVR